ncbi:hypothetical protein BOX15_Mlig030266g5, partial [Macrostomum lignano]
PTVQPTRQSPVISMATRAGGDATYSVNDKAKPGFIRVSFDLPGLKKGLLDGSKNAKKTSNSTLNVSIAPGSAHFGSVSIKGQTKGHVIEYQLRADPSELLGAWLGSPPSYYEVEQGVLRVFLKLAD